PGSNDQSNFGTGYGYQYGTQGTVEIKINDKWRIFATEEMRHELQFPDNENNLSDETDWEISLSAENISPTGLTLICTHSGGNPTGELQTGSNYKLYARESEIWEEVPYIVDNVAWTMEAYMIPSDGFIEQKLNWEKLNGSLPAGKYRLAKDFMDFRATGDYDTKIFYTEFEITE
ncbi:MAG: hypothetical protein IJC39_01840, partial [Firmicutes bacterium]|nr:hypothetical protein [Bacillota bacterium]